MVSAARAAAWGGVGAWCRGLVAGVALIPGVGLGAELASSTGAAVPHSDPAAVTLGLLLPPGETFGPSILAGARLAAERFQGEGGVRLVVRGREGQWGDDGTEAGRMVLEDGVRVLIAPPGGVPTHLALQVAGRTRTPVLLLGSEGSSTSSGVPWVLRVVPSAVAELRALVAEEPGRTRVLVPEGRMARELGRDLGRARAVPGAAGVGKVDEERGVAVDLVFEAELVPVPVEPAGAVGGERPVRPTPERVARLLGDGPATVVVWMEPGAAAAWVRALREGGYRGRLAGPGWLRSPDFVERAGAAAEGFQVAEMDPGLEGDGGVRAGLRLFAADYRERTGRQPDAIAVAAADAVGLAVALVREAGEEPVAGLLPFPAGSTPGSGLTGPWVFDRNGDRSDRLRRIHWREGGWRPVAFEAGQGRGLGRDRDRSVASDRAGTGNPPVETTDRRR